MAEVKWIKITTDIFDNLKIKHLKAVPELGHALVCIWFELLCMAGSCNKCGMLSMSNNLAITEDLIAEAFHEDIKLVQMALRMFQEMGMIEITENNSIQIANWLEYQSGDRLEEMREKNNERQKKYRNRQKLLNSDTTRDVTRDVIVDVTPSYSISSSDSLSSSLSKDIKEIIDYLNTVTNSNYKYTTEKTRTLIKARMNEKFTVDDFKVVIDKKNEEWKGTEMEKYLRPETLFGTKFESYLNSKIVKQNNQRDLIEELMKV